MQEPYSQTLASSRSPQNNRVVHTFECSDIQEFPTRIVRKHLSRYRADIVVQLPKFTPFDTAANQLSQSPEDSLIDPTEDRLTDLNPLLQSLDSSQRDSEDNSLDTSLPEIPIEMEPAQLINQLLTQVTTKPSTEIHPVPFAVADAENVLNWLKNVNRIVTHNVWNDQKQFQVIPVYLKHTTLNFYRSLPDQTETNINLLKAALRDRYHTQALLIRQSQTYNDVVTFGKLKHHFANTNSDTQDLLQEIRKEVSLKHTGINQEPYSTPVQDTLANQLQQDISQLQTDMQVVKNQ